MSEQTAPHTELTETTAEIVAAYVTKNHVSPADMPALIRSVHDTLADLGKAEPVEAPAELKPAVPVKKSVTDEYIISLEDGRKLKSMKRYLAKLGMTPADYRAKWGLPADYPMVAPAYSSARSAAAKGMGFGRRAKPVEVAPAPIVEAPVAQPEVEAPKRRGRAKKAA